MHSLTYKTMIWKTTWYKKHGAPSENHSIAESMNEKYEQRGPQKEKAPSFWTRMVKHGLHKA
jgi:hypothetical protein